MNYDEEKPFIYRHIRTLINENKIIDIPFPLDINFEDANKKSLNN